MVQREHIATPVAIFDYIFEERIHTFSKLCAINYFDPEFKAWFGVYLYFASMFLAVGCTGYTVTVYDSDWKLKTITMWGTTIQGIVKYFTIFFAVPKIRKGLKHLRAIYEANNYGTPRGAILMKWNRRFIVLLNMFYFMIIGGLTIFLLYPLLAFVLDQTQKEYVLPIFCPFFDENSTIGYALSITIQAGWSIQAAFGLAAADGLLAMQVFQAMPLVELFEYSFTELNSVLGLQQSNILAGSIEVKLCVRNLEQMQQELFVYLDNISEMYSVAFFTDVYSNGFTLCFIMFCLMVQIWFPLYLLFIVTLVKLFIMCCLGTIVEISTDRLLTTIDNSKWYALPVSLQKEVALMIVRAQNPTIMMAGTVPLSLDTFVNIMNNVYKIAMFLAEAIE